MAPRPHDGTRESQESRALNEDLVSFFDPRLCIFDLKARTKDEALEEIVDLWASLGRRPSRQYILNMLQHREALGSTATGKGVALPHGRSLAVTRLVAIFARSRQGIDFDSLDGAPTHLFFVLLAPLQEPIGNYLPVLGRMIERAMKDDVLRNRLLQASTFKEFVGVLRGG